MTYDEIKSECIRIILSAFAKGENLEGAISHIIQIVCLWQDEQETRHEI